MASDGPAADYSQATENADRWGHSGFLQFDDGSLDHLAVAEDRVELDLFDDDEDAVPEFALPLLPNEQDLVDKMRATIQNTQNTALQRRTWDSDSLQVFEHRLQAIVQSQEPTEEDAQKRNLVLQQVNKLVIEGLRGWHGMHVAPYGSFVSGMYTSTGDLDISIEGTRILGNEAKPCAELEKEEKVQLLKGLARKLNTARPPMVGKMEYVMHARVPIIKLEHTSGVECDISVASGAARFKSTVLRYLADIDPRFSSLVRLVKLWAGAHGMNDAASGTFNSFALTLMVTFHLQTQQPPILPALCELFQQSQDVLRGRPLHAGRQPQDSILEACGEVAWTKYHSYGRDNKSTVTELLASFFVLYHQVLERWSRERSTGLRYVRISTWCGAWTYRPWAKPYCVGVEDPFDCTDNCARTIAAHSSSSVARKFAAAAEHMMCIDPSTVPTDASQEEPQSLEYLLFTKPPAVEKKSGGRGRGGGRWGRGRGRWDRASDRPRPSPLALTIPLDAEPQFLPAVAAAMQAPPGLRGEATLTNSPVQTQPPPPPRQPFFLRGSTQQPYSSQGSTQQPYPSQGSTQQPYSSQGSTQQPYSSHDSAQELPPGLQFVRSQQPSKQSSASPSGVQVFPARHPRQHQGLDHNISLQTAGSNGWDHDLDRFNPDAGTLALDEGFGAQHAQQLAQPRFESSSSDLSAQRAQHLARPSFEHSSNGASAHHAQHTAVTGLFQRMDVSSQVSHPQYSSSSQLGYGNEYSSSHSVDGQLRQTSQHGAGSRSFRVTDRPQLGLQSQPKRRPYEPHKQPPSPLHAGDQAFGFGQSRGNMQPPSHIHASTSQGYHEQPQSVLYPQDGFHRESSTWDQEPESSSAYGSAPTGSEQGRAGYSSSQDGRGFGQSQRYGSTGLSGRTPSGKVLSVPRPSSSGDQGSYRRAGSHTSPVEPQLGPPPGLDHSTGEPELATEQSSGNAQSNKSRKNQRHWRYRGRGRGRHQQGGGQ